MCAKAAGIIAGHLNVPKQYAKLALRFLTIRNS